MIQKEGGYMRTCRSTCLLAACLFLPVLSVSASPDRPSSVISLKSCKLNIRADQISYYNRSIRYSGNVQFLYGLANVKMDKVILVKMEDGSCQLIARPWNGKALP